MMKKISVWLFATTAFLLASGFVDPATFRGTLSEKNAVISYIKQDVKRRYSAIGMDDPITLRRMEEKNLKSFKRLVRDRDLDPQLLQKVIHTYCAIDMCDYLTIDRMYHKQLDASKKSLQW